MDYDRIASWLLIAIGVLIAGFAAYTLYVIFR